MTWNVVRPSIAGRKSGNRRDGAGGLVAAAILACMSVGIAGCYNTAPLAGAPQPGTTVVLQLSDRGRVGMDSALGPSADQIEGRLESADASAYMLRTSSVRYLSGQTNVWNGEPVTVPAEYVSRAWMREYSRGRTLLAAAGIAGAAVAILAASDLLGGGAEPREGDPGPPVEQ